jgi:hypothetical protein
MARFEVFVPAAPPKLPVDLTLRLEADHWLGALKTGLSRLGETQASNNILCDIQADGSIHVTDPDSGRVFRIIELPATTPVGPMPAVAPAAPPAVQRPAPPPPAPFVMAPPDPEPIAARPVRYVPPPPPPPPARAPIQAPAPAPAPARTPAPAPTPTPASPSRPIGRLVTAVKAEDVLAELFLEVSDLGQMKDRKKGLEFVLDNALRIIGCEAGSVFTADSGRQDLSFEVVRGPSADKLKALGLKVPIGVGVVGFCAQENVSLAVSDVEKDPRFYRAVSEATGYQTRSLLCAPMAQQGRVVGCLEVLNKKGGKPYDQKDMAVLSYLAAQAAAFLARLDG